MPSTAPILMFIILVEAVSVIHEDYQRHKDDNKSNGEIAHVYVFSDEFLP